MAAKLVKLTNREGIFATIIQCVKDRNTVCRKRNGAASK